MRILSTSIHGVLDYLEGILLILAPMLLGFEQYGGAAVMVPRVVGVAIILMAVMTRYEMGVIRVIPMRVHLMMDMAVGALLAASPWLFGFASLPAHAWMPHLIVGVLIIGAAAMTQTQPGRAAV